MSTAAPVAPRRWPLARALAALAMSVITACADRDAPADTEFLVGTSDSTYWVAVARGAVRIQAGPMLVVRVDGRFTELYVADDDRSYFDAVFIGHRLFARDLIRGDSVELRRDTVVAALAARYAAAHPGEQPLGPDDPESDDAAIRATSDLEILAVHGANVSFEEHLDVDTRDDTSGPHRHEYRRGVLDIRAGRIRTLGDLFGPTVADSVVREGQAAWRAARDTVRAYAGGRSEGALRVLASFTFDSTSFTIGADGRVPTVRFAIPAAGTDPDVEPVELAPRRVPEPPWWAEAASELPLAPGDTARWTHRADTLLASPSAGGAGWVISLRVPDRPVRDLLRVSAPIERVIWLDSSVTSADRAALRRALTEGAGYGEPRQVAAAGARSPKRSVGAQGPASRRLPMVAITVHLPFHGYQGSRAASQRVAPRNVGAHDAAGREYPWPRVRRGDPRHARQDGRRVRDAALADAVRHRIG